MTFDDVLQDLIQRIGSNGGGILPWEQVREWPEGAIEVFEKAGWVKKAVPAKTVECPGCEENCFMPVHVMSAKNGKLPRAYVACDRRDDMGRVPIPLHYLQQWQISGGQVAKWVSRELSLKGKPKKDKATENFLIGDVQGKKKTGKVELVSMAPASLKTSGHSLQLSEVVCFECNQLQIDRTAILNMVDRPLPSNRYNSSIARREANKLDTQARHKGWQKAYRKLKREHPGKSD